MPPNIDFRITVQSADSNRRLGARELAQGYGQELAESGYHQFTALRTGLALAARAAAELALATPARAATGRAAAKRLSRQ